MKKMIATFAAGLLVVVAIAGFSLNDILEYAQVARAEAHKYVEGQIPNDVQIKRTKLILDKLDSEMSQIKHELAKAEIGLERSEADWQTAQNRRTGYVGNLRKLRSIDVQIGDAQYVSIGCSKVAATEVDAKLEATLSLYRECDKQCQQSKKLMEMRRKSVQALRQSLGQWNDKRILLEQRLDVLRTRNEVEIASSRIDGTVNDPSELNRAEELIDKIEERLDIAERERQLNGDFSDDLLSGSSFETTSAEDVGAEIDAILSNN